MLVVCPYEPGVHPLACRALDQHVPEVQYHRVGSAPDSYWRLLCQLWRTERSFMIVEHDVEVHEGVYPALRHCSSPWCTFPYTCHHPSTVQEGDDPLVYNALGCTRLRASLTKAEPDLLAQLVSPEAPAHMREQARNWRGLDAHIASALTRRGYEPHVHWPAVVHHHDYPKGCACGDNHREMVGA